MNRIKIDRELSGLGRRKWENPALRGTAKPEEQLTVPSSVHLEYSCLGFLLDVIMRASESYFRSPYSPVEPRKPREASRSGYPPSWGDLSLSSLSLLSFLLVR